MGELHHELAYEPLREFLEPFYKSESGQIYVLSGPNDDICDVLAAILVARHFPLPMYDLIKVEPSRPDIVPAPNIIIVGGMSEYVSPRPTRKRRIIPVGFAKLGARLGRIAKECCYAFEGDSNVVLVNRVTKARYVARQRGRPEFGLDRDHPVRGHGARRPACLEPAHILHAGRGGPQEVACDPPRVSCAGVELSV